jgi:hypothetical protein
MLLAAATAFRFAEEEFGDVFTGDKVTGLVGDIIEFLPVSIRSLLA